MFSPSTFSSQHPTLHLLFVDGCLISRLNAVASYSLLDQDRCYGYVMGLPRQLHHPSILFLDTTLSSSFRFMLIDCTE